MVGPRVLARCLAPVRGLEVTSVRADGPWKEGPELIDPAEGVVLYLAEGAKWLQDDPKRHEALARLAKRGGAQSSALGAQNEAQQTAAGNSGESQELTQALEFQDAPQNPAIPRDIIAKLFTGVYGNRTHCELCSNPPLVLKTRAPTRGANTPERRVFRGNPSIHKVL